MDSAFLLVGMLTAAAYYQGDDEEEREIRELADLLYRRADWRWAANRAATLTHGWRPESGFLPYRWSGYDEALLLYLLALGSPTHPLPEESYRAWLSTYAWRKVYDTEFVFAGPLFVTFLIVLFILNMQFLWKYVDDLMGKGLPTLTIAQLLFYAAAAAVPVAIPLAVLLSSIMTMGGLGERSELTPMRSAGLNLFSIMRPLLAALFALGHSEAWANMAVNNPASFRTAERLGFTRVGHVRVPEMRWELAYTYRLRGKPLPNNSHLT